MSYTHGDTVIFRSDRPERSLPRSRLREPERDREREPRHAQPRAEQIWETRLSVLEERLARLEAELAEAREAARHQPDPPVARSGGSKGKKGQAGGVKVSLHAEGGAQATVGEVRMRSDEV